LSSMVVMVNYTKWALLTIKYLNDQRSWFSISF
jgi:hypothetical protein